MRAQRTSPARISRHSDDPDDLITDLQTIAGPSAGLAGAQIYIHGLSAGDATLPDKTSIQEVRLNQNPFAPEFDSMGLGRIELLTKAGTDSYHVRITRTHSSTMAMIFQL